MAKARLHFDGDNSGIEKEARTYSLTQEVEDKLDSISNFQNEIDDLQDQINNLASRGRYLSTWNAVTGLPETNPQVDPYVYRAGDYYIVSVVGGTNYRPQGSEYHIGVASQAVETQGVEVNDLYIYDGVQWIKQGSGGGATTTWGSITGTLSSQADLQNALDGKQDALTAGAGIDIISNIISADEVLIDMPSVGDDLRTSGFIAVLTKGVTIKDGNNFYKVRKVIDNIPNDLTVYASNGDDNSGSTTGYIIVGDISNGVTSITPYTNNYFAPDNQGTVGQVLTKTAQGYEYTTIQTGGNYTAGNGIDIDQNDEISIDTNVVATQSDLSTGLETKQNTLTAGTGIIIGGQKNTSQGPCPDGYHIPTLAEASILTRVGVALSQQKYPGDTMRYSKSAGDLTLPCAGYIEGKTGVFTQDDGGTIWTSTTNSTYLYQSYCAYFKTANNFVTDRWQNATAVSIRPFKDEPVIPDISTWTEIFNYLSFRAYYNTTEGIISLSDNSGTSWITMSDKNLGATVVYSYGDTLSANNCGGLYQWGNNHAFTWGVNPTTTSTNTINVSTYGPRGVDGYYDSETFIIKSTGSVSWYSPAPKELWGDNSQVIIPGEGNVIANNGVTDIQGQTGSVPAIIKDTVGTSVSANNIWVGTDANFSSKTKSTGTLYFTYN